MEEYFRGTTPRFENLFKDITGSPANASGTWAYLSDVNGNMIGSTNTPTASGTGIYFWETTIPATGSLGFWRMLWTGSVNNLPVRDAEIFRIIEKRQI